MTAEIVVGTVLGARLPRRQPQLRLIKEGVNLLHVVATLVGRELLAADMA